MVVNVAYWATSRTCNLLNYVKKKIPKFTNYAPKFKKSICLQIEVFAFVIDLLLKKLYEA